MAAERFKAAEEQYVEERFHTASHLFINACVNYHNAICQKFLNRIPSHKAHFDTSYFKELAGFFDKDFSKYQTAYEFLMAYKSEADYGVEFSQNIAKQIQRRANTIKEIAGRLL
ncbi:MAG: hypothetical protein Q7K42_00650 [Candidatus Diapherotrites archaeon]|nr:hypothetical protein [Candidatus Diapherotrites archaeon]